MHKALVLFSGGLDSLLATRMMQEEPGIEVVAVHFCSLFTGNHSPGDGELAAEKSARDLGLELIVEENSEILLNLIKHPKHGLGSNMNPCIDCRIRNVNRAKELMPELGADFLVTGEVVGERPMSQNRNAMRLIDKETGTAGILLRPLCAKVIEPTTPEEEGWVDREHMEAIHGRSRKPQMALAKKYDLKTYPSPAGGCLLTDPGFSLRMKDLLDHLPDCDVNDCLLLKVGRHFRLNPSAKVVVGRNQGENVALEKIVREGDHILQVTDLPGPISVVRGECSDEDMRLAAAITARYGKAMSEQSANVRIQAFGSDEESAPTVDVVPAVDDDIESLWIAPAHALKRDKRGSE
jgi:tRNA-uridine 2-sulfurtransferase